MSGFSMMVSIPCLWFWNEISDINRKYFMLYKPITWDKPIKQKIENIAGIKQIDISSMIS